MSKILYQQDKGHGRLTLIQCFLSKIDHPHYFLDQILADPVLNIPEKGEGIQVSSKVGPYGENTGF